MSKQIQLTKGYVTIVDDDDYEWLTDHSWYAHDSNSRYCYAKSRIKGKLIRMHRLILLRYGLLENSKQVDHIDHDGLNNQKANLRACTKAENMRNRKGPFKNGYLGICRSGCKKNSWKAAIMINGKRIHLGHFPTKEEAARAYDVAARRCHKEFATVNFPLSHERSARCES